MLHRKEFISVNGICSSEYSNFFFFFFSILSSHCLTEYSVSICWNTWLGNLMWVLIMLFVPSCLSLCLISVVQSLFFPHHLYPLAHTMFFNVASGIARGDCLLLKTKHFSLKGFYLRNRRNSNNNNNKHLIFIIALMCARYLNVIPHLILWYFYHFCISDTAQRAVWSYIR